MQRKTSSSFWFTASCWGLLFLPLCLQAQKDTELIRRRVMGGWYQNVVSISVKPLQDTEEPRNGVGFIVGEEADSLFIVTAFHTILAEKFEQENYTFAYDRSLIQSSVSIFISVAKPAAGAKNFTLDSLSLPARFLHAEAETNLVKDVALLKFEKPDDFVWKANCLNIRAKVGDDITYATRDDGLPVTTRWGQIERINGILLTTTWTSVKKGDSGGPAFTSDGISGMVLKIDSNKGELVSIEAIQNWLKTTMQGQYASAFQLICPGCSIVPILPRTRWSFASAGIASAGVGTYFLIDAWQDYKIYRDHSVETDFVYNDQSREDLYQSARNRHRLALGLMVVGGLACMAAWSDKIPGLKTIHKGRKTNIKKREATQEIQLGLSPDVIPAIPVSGSPWPAYGVRFGLSF